MIQRVLLANIFPGTEGSGQGMLQIAFSRELWANIIFAISPLG